MQRKIEHLVVVAKHSKPRTQDVLQRATPGATFERATAESEMNLVESKIEKHAHSNWHDAMQRVPSFHLRFSSRDTRVILFYFKFKHPRRLKSMPSRNTFGSVERKIDDEYILRVNKNLELAHDFFVRTDSNLSGRENYG